MDLVLGEMGESGWMLAGFVSVLMIVPTLLLVLSCANVANLRLSRATARTRELAVRVALGASRSQLVRLIATEAAVLGAGALAVSWLGTQVLIWQLGETFLEIPVRIDPAVVAFSVAVAVVVVGLSGLVPAWLVTRRATAMGLKLTAQAGGVTHARLRHALVIAQVTVSVLLLSLGSLLLRSLQTREDTVWDPGPVVMAALDLRSQGYDVARATSFAFELAARLAADPRISHVGFSELPFPGSRTVRVRVAGASSPRSALAAANWVTPGWFGALGLVPTAGRVFSAADGAQVAVISASLARALAPDSSPIGMPVSVLVTQEEQLVVRVSGVIPDGAAVSPRSERTAAGLYLPLPSQMPGVFSVMARARSSSEAIELVPHVNRLIASVAPSMPWTQVETASTIRAAGTRDSRALAFMIGGAGLFGLLLSAAGLFAVMSYTVSLRTREIGVRVALGGQSSDVVRLVMRQAVRLTVFGAVMGLTLAVPLAFVMRSALFGVSPLDPLALGGTISLLLLTAIAASAAPALRAANTSPLVAIRAE
jgi:predicted permease